MGWYKYRKCGCSRHFAVECWFISLSKWATRQWFTRFLGQVVQSWVAVALWPNRTKWLNWLNLISSRFWSIIREQWYYFEYVYNITVKTGTTSLFGTIRRNVFYGKTLNAFGESCNGIRSVCPIIYLTFRGRRHYDQGMILSPVIA